MFAWSRTTYALWRGIIFNFEDKWDLDYFLAHSDANRVTSKWAYDNYWKYSMIQVESSRKLGANEYRRREVKRWKEESKKMNTYRIRYVDGHDGIYKERIVEAENMSEGIDKLKKSYNGDFEHWYQSIYENDRLIWER